MRTIAMVGMVAVTCAGCALETGAPSDDGEAEIGEVQEAAMTKSLSFNFWSSFDSGKLAVAEGA